MAPTTTRSTCENNRERIFHGALARDFCAIICLTTWLSLSAPASAETGYDGWLRYAPIEDKEARKRYDDLPAVVVALGDSDVIRSAQQELVRGVRGMLGRTLRSEREIPKEDAIILGTFDAIKAAVPEIGNLPKMAEDGYWKRTVKVNGETHVLVAGPNDRGVLYGTFALLRKIALQQQVLPLNAKGAPYAPIRLLNQWDNIDGSIEHGYGGRSIFWQGGHVVGDLTRVRDYARLMASLGINGCSVNNVNADARVISTELVQEVAGVADVFRPWGVRTYIAIDLASPHKVGGVNSPDPLDPRALEFWKKKVDEIYAAIPDLGGFVLQATPRERAGAGKSGPTHAEIANALARLLKPHGGVLFYRDVVCDHAAEEQQPPRDPAMASYENFHRLDGLFEDNVVIQIKHGPIEFQVREPVSPLLGGLKETNEVIELQITQEYLGQQRHLCFLVPMWKEVLDFDLHATEESTPVRQLVAGKTFQRPLGGLVGVANVGRDANWLGHQLAMANLYGFGRLAWNPDLAGREIAEEWTRLSFGHDPLVVGTVVDMLLRSWRTYENYTGPLGVGILPDPSHIHYGPGIQTSEANGRAQWRHADQQSIGVDRTVATGSGFIGQYSPQVAGMYESLETCPDELVLFMHRVPYTHGLHSGKTVIQHIYDSHYQGARDAGRMVGKWRSLRDRVDDQRYEEVLAQLEYQAGHALAWRDAICSWFMYESGIADDENRVGNHTNRFEAESMKLEGYEPRNVTPWETASGGQCARCIDRGGRGAVSFQYEGDPGWFDLITRYFDENDGQSRYRLLVGGQEVDSWTADASLPDDKPNGRTSTQHKTPRVALRPGDEIRIEAVTDGGERAAVDYVTIEPAGK